jgi:transposase
MENSGNGSSASRGRPRRLSQMQLAQAMDLHLREGVPIREIAGWLGVSHMTVWRALCSRVRGGGNG